MTYWAHSSRQAESGVIGSLGWQPLAEHLEAVGELAAQLAALARPGDRAFAADARLAGLLHDLGKYTDAFQRRITAGGKKCQHAIHGAMVAAGASKAPLHPQAALAIAGHHAGIPDYSGVKASLAQKLKEPKEVDAVALLWPRAVGDSATVKAVLEGLGTNHATNKIEPAAYDLYTRMLFSCLVDADRLNSAGREPLQASLRAAERLDQLRAHLSGLRQSSSGSPIQALRDEVLDDCLRAAPLEQSLFSLAVPTGGGKTLAAMAFALQRASLLPERFRRVVVVIPYLSIIEQNARVYREVFGSDAVLEHHSGSTMPLERRLGRDSEGKPTEPEYAAGNDENDEEMQDKTQRPETENWDAPIVVTTSTRFFESLFSNRPKDLRRVHNLARSIVIFDEVQTLPRRLLAPLLKMQKELADDWGVNFVFSTATQPAFEVQPGRSNSVLWPRGTVTEIVKDPERMRKALRRTQIEWEIDETQSWDRIAARMLKRNQCLTVVNLREHALELYRTLKVAVEERGEAGGVFHLSTRMCAAHRLRTIDTIRKRLKEGLDCRVVSTQLIEAGVDLDFPLVLRALAPLDAIVQAAGRADREGRMTAALGRPGGEVVVFRPTDERMPPHEYKEAAGITEALAREGAPVQVDDAESMRTFYARYYAPGDETALGSRFNAMRHELKFATLAAEFEYINSRTRDVFVPDGAEACAAIAELDRIGQLPFTLRRTLQQHTVGLNPTEFEKARSAGVVRELRQDSEIWIAAEFGYSEEFGLNFNPGPDSYVVS